MKKTLLIVSLALVGVYAACQKSKSTSESKFVTASTVSNPVSVASVYFGKPPAGGGVCQGLGICTMVSAGTGASGTTVAFQLSSSNSNILLMGFHMSDLYNNQPEQKANFLNGSYTFATNYLLNNAVFTPLSLPANAAIDTNTVNTVTINGDSVTVAYVYYHP